MTYYPAESRKQIVTTCTRDCTNTCGLIATVENGRVKSLSGNPAHPFTSGRICHKAAKFIDRVYSPERVLSPLRKENGEWKKVSWDDALDEIAERMKEIRGFPWRNSERGRFGLMPPWCLTQTGNSPPHPENSVL